MSNISPSQELLDLCQENVRGILNIEDGVVIKAILITAIVDKDDEWIVSVCTDAKGESLSLWDRLGLIEFTKADIKHRIQGGKEE